MKKDDDFLYPPKDVKVDTITDEEAYLSEKLKEKRAEYQLKMQSKKQPSRLYLLFYIVATITLIVGLVLNYTYKPQAVGLLILSASALLMIVGLLLSPRKSHEANPFEFKLIKPESMSPTRESKKTNRYRFTFDFTDKDGKCYLASTESKYSEEEKEKICKSFVNGTLIVAADKDWHAEILEY